MLFNPLKRMMLRGQTEGLKEKIEVFYMAKEITNDEYIELIDLLNNTNK